MIHMTLTKYVNFSAVSTNTDTDNVKFARYYLKVTHCQNIYAFVYKSIPGLKYQAMKTHWGSGGIAPLVL
jgi:hypothetical protein